MFNKIKLWMLEQQMKVVFGEEPKKALSKKKTSVKNIAVKKTTKKK